MKQKEYDAYRKLSDLAHTFRCTELRETEGKEIDELDAVLSLLHKLEDFDMDKKYRELLKEGITAETTITSKKSVPTLKKLPAKCSVGSRIYVEDAARYFVKGIKKWVYLPSYYFSGNKKNGNKIPKEYFQDL